MTLKEAKAAIRTFIREHWDDAKLAEVYAFNQDGHMRYTNPCACLLGVTTRTVHVGYCKESGPFRGQWPHYEEAEKLNGAALAETGYGTLGFHRPTMDKREFDYYARVRMSAILRVEMRRRAAFRTAQLKAMVEECSHA